MTEMRYLSVQLKDEDGEPFAGEVVATTEPGPIRLIFTREVPVHVDKVTVEARFLVPPDDPLGDLWEAGQDCE